MGVMRNVVNDILAITTRPPDKSNYNFTFKLLMLIDALGLWLIALCTMAEALEDWDKEFRDHFFGNETALFYWILGAMLATLGLVAIMFNCAAMERLPYLEHVGMFMLTFAPVVNCVGWYYLNTGDLLDNYTLVATEVIEFIGMNALNYSYWCKDPWSDCFVEVTGYCILACAAMLDVFIYPEKMTEPVVTLRTSTVNRMDVIGLIALMIVSIGKYQMHVDGVPEYSISMADQHDAGMLEMLPCAASLPSDTINIHTRKKTAIAHVEKDYND
mmetsp:Transcript_9341/g.17419  ORF Transcript_9341/g.17419 Transcript_9341/m.17419 type:complete len:272 (-) Transcript_9341:126-941(-)